MRNNEQGELPYPVVCSSSELKHVVSVGWGEGVKRNIPRSRSAVRPQLEWRATPVSTRGPLSVVFLSLSFCPAGRAGASQPPTSQIQASSARPCVAFSGNSFRMLPVHCVRAGPPQHMSLLSIINYLRIIFIFLPCASSNDFSSILYTIIFKFVLTYVQHRASGKKFLNKLYKHFETKRPVS